VFVIALTVFSVLVSFPSDPNRYLPGFIPWPEEECVGPGCIGKGIKVGSFERREMAHTATQDAAAFGTGIIDPGATSTPVAISTTGSFGYHCEIHPTTMTGTLVVIP
jgi:hypothetical protein